jgi:hypothetical protein
MYIPKSLDTLARAILRGKYRPNLRRVFLERDDRGEPYAYATDGKQMMIATWLEPFEECLDSEWQKVVEGEDAQEPGFAGSVTPEDFLIHTEAIPSDEDMEHGKALRGYEWGRVQEEIIDGSVCLTASDGRSVITVQSPQLDVDPPNWRKVLPKYKRANIKSGDSAVTILVDPALLVSLLRQVQEFVGAHAGKPVALTVPMTGKAPLVIEQTGDDRAAVGVLMPMIGDLESENALERMHAEDEG